MLETTSDHAGEIDVREPGSLELTEQVVRLQALLEASRAVHSTIEVGEVLREAARVAVLELEMEGAYFTAPPVSFGRVHRDSAAGSRFALLSREGRVLSELVVLPPDGRLLSMYEHDFLEGLVLQTAVALENAINHKRHVEYARVEQDLDAARMIQQSLLPQVMPMIPGYSLAARSRACYHVGGDYLDIVAEQDGRFLMVLSDVAGKGLASALVCTAFRSAFRALARHGLPLDELAAKLSRQHWEEGTEARRRYVTAVFLRLNPDKGLVEMVNAGHNPAFVFSGEQVRRIGASGAPLGMLPSMEYEAETFLLQPDARVLLYTDGLTELCHENEEFGEERLQEAFGERISGGADVAGQTLDTIWQRLDSFSRGAPQQDDMSALALCRLTGQQKVER